MTANWYPCCDCGDGGVVPGCLISDGWECDVKNGIDSADVTGWSVDSGTWDATQDWESGSTADALETSSSSARISCDTQQSLPLDDRMRVTYYVQVTHADDEAVVLLAGFKVVLKSDSAEIKSGGATLASRPYGIGLSRIATVKVCTWLDDDTSLEYIGVVFNTSTTSFSMVAEVTLGTNGTTEFGSDSVTGTVSFHHADAAFRCGDFYHNTTRTDGSGLDCKSCMMTECAPCPAGDSPRYLTVEISGFTSPYGGYCSDCEDWDGTHVFDLGTVSGECGYSIWMLDWADICDAGFISGIDPYCYFYPTLTVSLMADGANWKVQVTVSETIVTSSTVPLTSYAHAASEGRLSYATHTAVYEKSYTSSDSCCDIDDDIPFVESDEQSSPDGCGGYDSLTIHVTASN